MERHQVEASIKTWASLSSGGEEEGAGNYIFKALGYTVVVGVATSALTNEKTLGEIWGGYEGGLPGWLRNKVWVYLIIYLWLNHGLSPSTYHGSAGPLSSAYLRYSRPSQSFDPSLDESCVNDGVEMKDVWVASATRGKWILPGVDLELRAGEVTRVRTVGWGEVAREMRGQVEGWGRRERGKVEGRMVCLLWEGGEEGGGGGGLLKKRAPKDVEGGLVTALEPYYKNGSLEGVCVIAGREIDGRTRDWLLTLGACVVVEGEDGVDFDEWRKGT
ncbi:hypothetical protein TrRE_jg9150 [Triparma retinervis]|uniref:Uncharacterized protein n=1 Tax=Triparma retinervis TaxID=2557542 RepID=A0A9W7DPE0_9STRA|nr:hypothetical protein TrRE_jg9150 [Triparma retinervis]